MNMNTLWTNSSVTR